MESKLKLARTIASKYYTFGRSNYQDLLAIADMSVIEAINKFPNCSEGHIVLTTKHNCLDYISKIISPVTMSEKTMRKQEYPHSEPITDYVAKRDYSDECFELIELIKAMQLDERELSLLIELLKGSNINDLDNGLSRSTNYNTRKSIQEKYYANLRN